MKTGQKMSNEQKMLISNANKGRIFSREHREKIALAQIGNKNMLGKTHSIETRKLLSLKFRGRKLSEETKKKISRYMKLHAPFKGKHLSEETKNKISLSKTGKMTGEKSYIWKGENAGYRAKHMWIAKYFGRPRRCDFCKQTNQKRYHWANISGKYKRTINDYLRLCAMCHRHYDLYINHYK